MNNTRRRAKFPEEDHISVQEAAPAARAASVTDQGKGLAPSWRPEGEFIPQMAFEAIYSRSALSGAGSDG